MKHFLCCFSLLGYMVCDIALWDVYQVVTTTMFVWFMNRFCKPPHNHRNTLGAPDSDVTNIKYRFLWGSFKKKHLNSFFDTSLIKKPVFFPKTSSSDEAEKEFPAKFFRPFGIFLKHKTLDYTHPGIMVFLSSSFRLGLGGLSVKF